MSAIDVARGLRRRIAGVGIGDRGRRTVPSIRSAHAEARAICQPARVSFILLVPWCLLSVLAHVLMCLRLLLAGFKWAHTHTHTRIASIGMEIYIHIYIYQ